MEGQRRAGAQRQGDAARRAPGGAPGGRLAAAAEAELLVGSSQGCADASSTAGSSASGRPPWRSSAATARPCGRSAGSCSTTAPALRSGTRCWPPTAADSSPSRQSLCRAPRGPLARGPRRLRAPAFPPIELRYRPSPAAGLEGRTAIADALDRIADRERRRQMPLLGPHRDELEILWGGTRSGRVASAGERKALSLMLLAAHGRVMEAAGAAAPLHARRHGRGAGAADRGRRLGDLTVAQPQLFATSNRPQVWLTLDVATLWEMERGELRLLSIGIEETGNPLPGIFYLPFLVAVVPEGRPKALSRASALAEIGSKPLNFQR